MKISHVSSFGFVRIAVATPVVRVANVRYNLQQHLDLIAQATTAQIIVFPELSLTGYSCADLFRHTVLVEAASQSLCELAEATRHNRQVIVAGLPVRYGDNLYDCAAVINAGEVKAVVPKFQLTDDESHWFSGGALLPDDASWTCGESQVPIISRLSFTVGSAQCCIAVGSDWMEPMADNLYAVRDAHVIINPTAHMECVGHLEYMHRARLHFTEQYLNTLVCAEAGYGESTTDVVYGGNSEIVEEGEVLAVNERFAAREQLIVADTDIDRLYALRLSRRHMVRRPSVGQINNVPMQVQIPDVSDCFYRKVPASPFVPEDTVLRTQRCEEIFGIQVRGLMTRLQHIGAQTAVIGISGGLDSTLALLVTVKAFDLLGWERSRIVGITMPGFGTSGRTYNNSIGMMQTLGITLREISIVASVNQHFADLGIDASVHDVTYENSQARERTQILMDAANQTNGIVIGTGDLSELALGWCTYNGDHMSMYAVNADVPKTLIRHLVKWAAESWVDAATCPFLLDVVDTPISPELIPTDDAGNIAQKTEDLVGPYELHDFFLYYTLRLGYTPAKVYFLASKAFVGQYDETTIKRWLQTFYRRFFSQQFKRSCLCDGPKVGTVGISPRSDLRMPSDAWSVEWTGQDIFS